MPCFGMPGCPGTSLGDHKLKPYFLTSKTNIMKKYAYFILILLCLAWTGTRLQSQQVAYYGFSEETGQAYMPLTDATVLAESSQVQGTTFKNTFFNETGSVLLQDSTTSLAGIPIGFDFQFDGKTYDKFVAGGVGYIVLGDGTSEEVTLSWNTMFDRFLYPRIGLGTDGDMIGLEGTSISYKLEGTSPNRILAVEFNGMAYSSDIAEASDGLRYQIRLHESDNHIEILFGKEVSFGDSWDWYSIGLRGESGGHFRSPVNGNWGETAFNSLGNVSARNTTLPDGLKYTFTLPEPCEAPTGSASGLTLAATSTTVSGAATVSEGAADGYIVVSSTSEITGVPEAGTYAAGDALLGGTVLATGELSGTSISFEEEDLNPNTTYHYAVYLYNFKCSGQPQYGPSTTGSISTYTSAPAALSIVSVSGEEIVLSVESNEKDEPVLIAVTEIMDAGQAMYGYYMGDFGMPASDADAGDTLVTEEGSFGGMVLYAGPASDAISFTEGLEDNTLYWFAAYSLGENGQYSSLFTQADTITPAILPFEEDFTNMPTYTYPYGWEGSSEDFRVQRNGGTLSASFAAVTGGQSMESQLVLPPIDIPEGNGVRLVLDYGMGSYKSRFDNSLYRTDWTDQDSIVFEYSSGGEDTWTKVFALTSLNADEFATGSERYVRNIDYKGISGQDVRLRMRYVYTFGFQTNMDIYPIRVLEIPDCDYPASVWVPDSSIVGSRAQLDWTPGASEESVWNISYAVQDEEGNWGEWSEAEEVNAHPYQLDGLLSNRVYKARVQAVCGVGSTSDWVESGSFNSGWTVSFMEDFNNLPVDESIWYASVEMPYSWEVLSSRTNEDTLVSSDMLSGMVDFLNWKSADMAVPGESNGSIAVAMNRQDIMTMIQLPVVELDAEQNPCFVFDAVFAQFDEDGNFESLPDEAAVPSDYKMHLLVSKDNGETFLVDEALQSWDATQMADFGDSLHVEVPLSGLEGKVILALAAYGNYDYQSTSYILYLDNMGILYERAVAQDLEVSGITETSAVLSWREEITVDEWVMKLEGGEETRLLATPSNQIELTGLAEATDYVAHVGNVCGEGDTVWASTGFSTGGVECDPVTGLAVSGINQTSATLAWQGSALSYRVRIRPAGQENYSVYTTTESSYVFSNLLAGTEYEGGVQAVCGQAVTDTSAYVAFEPFQTTGITCFPPTALAASEVTWNSATLTWEGEAEDYQVEWREENTTVSLGRLSVEGTKTGTITGLEALTPYQARVRGICSAGDTSAWCDWVGFATTAITECPVPTNLRVESLAETSATLLWDADEQNENFTLRYRATVSTSWDSVKNLAETQYELTGLEPQTAYVWSVMAACSEGRYSGWGTQNNFTTEGVGNEADAESGLFLTASRHQLHVMNPGAVRIERIRVYTLGGSLAEDYVIRSNENVILTTALSMQVVVVEILTADESALRFKVMLP